VASAPQAGEPSSELSRSLLGATLARSSEASELERRLSDLDPSAIAGDEARIALWLNLYNALLLRELERKPRTGSVLRHRGLFGTASYRVGDQEYSLDQIEHGVLRRNARPPYRLRRPFGSSDRRREASPSYLEPRIHFALNCGAVSCPAIKPYTAATLQRELDSAAATYIRAETTVDRERGRVELPYLMRLYGDDFGGRAGATRHAARHLSDEDARWLRERDPAVGFARFDWTLAPADQRRVVD
jgi:hypothetical protein